MSGCTWVTHWAGTLKEERELGHPQYGGEAVEGCQEPTAQMEETGQPPPCLSSDLSTEASSLPFSRLLLLHLAPKEDAPRLVPFHILPRGLYQLSPSRLASVSKAWELPNSVWVYCKRTQRPEHLWGQTQGP